MAAFAPERLRLTPCSSPANPSPARTHPAASSNAQHAGRPMPPGACLLWGYGKSTLHAMIKRRTRPCGFSKRLACLALALGLAAGDAQAQEPWVTYAGDDGPGKGKHI